MKANKLLLAARHPAAVQLPIEGELPSFSGATAWLNSPPLSAAGPRGKVWLIDFWTYTCINWVRTLPYVRAWAEKYQEHGVVVIGVHSPEFPFEHDIDNVRRAAKDMRVAYPISIMNWFRSMPMVLKQLPIGTASGLRKPMSALSAPSTLRLPVEQ